MVDLQFKIHINAPREKVWHAMLDDASYREWTYVFYPGSYFEGDWSAGSTMRFLGPSDKEGEQDGGMYATVVENRAPEFVSLQHRGEIQNGVDKPWDTNGFENYTFEEKDGGTEVIVDLLNLPEEFKDMFDDSWPKALEKLKEVAER